MSLDSGVRENQAENRTRKRVAPFSLRLTAGERERLSSEAAGAPLGSYIKAKVLGGVPPIHMRRSGLAIEDRKALAQGLALLGKSQLANNLNQLAHAANSGSLVLDPETQADLAATLDGLRDLRRVFLVALGLKSEGAE